MKGDDSAWLFPGNVFLEFVTILAQPAFSIFSSSFRSKKIPSKNMQKEDFGCIFRIFYQRFSMPAKTSSCFGFKCFFSPLLFLKNPVMLSYFYSFENYRTSCKNNKVQYSFNKCLGKVMLVVKYLRRLRLLRVHHNHQQKRQQVNDTTKMLQCCLVVELQTITNPDA